MGDNRQCVQCGSVFTPRREHARFCSPRCRTAWNREHGGASEPGEEVLEWAAGAMTETTEELLDAHYWAEPDGFAVITEAVWWVTMVDATLVRYRPDAYGRALARHDAPERQVIEDTFGGLRFVRNRIGNQSEPADLIEAASGEPARRVADWHWKTVPEPACPSQAGRGPDWDASRYNAYKAALAGQTIGGTFDRAFSFLKSAMEQRVA